MSEWDSEGMSAARNGGEIGRRKLALLVFPVRRLGRFLCRDELCAGASRRRPARRLFAREAQEAQLRALRYQINPHFLFNTLNSLSSLVLTKRTETAERMLMNLSTFFRATLSADPTADVPLDEEIKLQRLYLDIEQIRFPDRLTVEIDVPEACSTRACRS